MRIRIAKVTTGRNNHLSHEEFVEMVYAVASEQGRQNYRYFLQTANPQLFKKVKDRLYQIDLNSIGLDVKVIL